MKPEKVTNSVNNNEPVAATCGVIMFIKEASIGDSTNIIHIMLKDNKSSEYLYEWGIEAFDKEAKL